MLLLHLCSTPGLLQVFSQGELELIADLCEKHDILCISDEVYEWLVYDGKKHIRIGMENDLLSLDVFSGYSIFREGTGDLAGDPWKLYGLLTCMALLGMYPH